MENRSIFEIVAAVLALTTIVGISIELHCEKRMRSYLASRNAELWMSEMQSRNASLDIADRLAVEIDIHNDTIYESEEHGLLVFEVANLRNIIRSLGYDPETLMPLLASQAAHASTSPS